MVLIQAIFLILGKSRWRYSTGTHRTQGGGLGTITGQDQGEDRGLDGVYGLHIVRQVSQKHSCVKEEMKKTVSAGGGVRSVSGKTVNCDQL